MLYFLFLKLTKGTNNKSPLLFQKDGNVFFACVGILFPDSLTLFFFKYSIPLLPNFFTINCC